MSNNISNIGNSVYRFTFSLAKLAGEDSANMIIPVPKGSIKYLSIEDSLSNPGYTGEVLFNNFFGIIEKLGLGVGSSNSTVLFDINIENLDFNETNLQDNALQAVVTLQDNTDTVTNPIDKVLLYSFEEYAVNLLKQKKVKPTDAVSGKISNSILNLIKTCFPTNSNIIDTESFDKLNAASNEMSINTAVMKSHSCFDIIKLLLKYNLYKADYISPTVLKLENYVVSDNDKKHILRKFTISPLFDKTRRLINALTSASSSTADTKEILLERFTIGGESSVATYRENIIETFSIIKPDFRTLYKDKWVNYTGVTTPANLTDIISLDINYQDLRESFEINALNSYASNLPVRRDIESDEIVEKVIAFDYVTATDNLVVDGIESMLYKSFIYDNSAIIFKTTGNPYRKPGSFIQVHDSLSSKSDASGFWYVISVKHIFEHEIYTNEIVAVKIFVGNENNRPIPTIFTPSPAPNNNTPVPPASDFIDPNNNIPQQPQQPPIDLPFPLPEFNDQSSDELPGGEGSIDDVTLFPLGDPVPDSSLPTTTVTPPPSDSGGDSTSDLTFDDLPEGIPFQP